MDPFWGAYVLKGFYRMGLYTEGNLRYKIGLGLYLEGKLRLKIYWASLKLEGNLWKYILSSQR